MHPPRGEMAPHRSAKDLMILAERMGIPIDEAMRQLAQVRADAAPDAEVALAVDITETVDITEPVEVPPSGSPQATPALARPGPSGTRAYFGHSARPMGPICFVPA